MKSAHPVARVAARVLADAFALGVLAWLVHRAQWGESAHAGEPPAAETTSGAPTPSAARRTRRTVIQPHSSSKSLVLDRGVEPEAKQGRALLSDSKSGMVPVQAEPAPAKEQRKQ
jgi:hypothetical protein